MPILGSKGFVTVADDQIITGEKQFDIDQKIGLLMTDDPTYQAMTYVFATTDDGLIAPDIVYDIRQTDLPNANGYESSRNKITGDLSTKITSKTAEISASYDASDADSFAKVLAGGQGLIVTDTGTGVRNDITGDAFYGITFNNESMVIMGAAEKTTIVDTDISPLSDGAYKRFTWLNAYNYIKSKLSAAGYIYLTRETLANIITNYPAASYPNCEALATDLNNTAMFSDGTEWRPVNGSGLVEFMKLPVAKAGAFTGTTNGAITFTTAFAALMPKCWVYYPANSIVASHAAGIYYTEMSSTTGAIVYDNVFTPAGGVNNAEPTVKTAFSGAVIGGAGTTSEITLFISRCKANSLGLFGKSRLQYAFEGTSSANAKNFRTRINGTLTGNTSVTTTGGLFAESFVKNMGATDSQRYSGALVNTTVNSTPGTLSVDTTADMDISFTVQSSTSAAENMAYVLIDNYLEK